MWSKGVKIHVGAGGWFNTKSRGCLQGRLVELSSGGPFLLTSSTAGLEAYCRLGLGFGPPNFFFPLVIKNLWICTCCYGEEGGGARSAALLVRPCGDAVRVGGLTCAGPMLLVLFLEQFYPFYCCPPYF